MRIRAIVALMVGCAVSGVAIAQVPAPTGVAMMKASDGYVLGNNDEVEVTLFGTGVNQVVRTRIKEDGTITVPYLGSVMARDRTARALSTEIAAQLRSGGYFTKPVVNVEVTQFISNGVTVFGEVGTPGVFPLDRPQTVGMMVARAGGVRPDGADYAILKRQGDSTEHRILLSTLAGEWSAATPLLASDTLYVPVTPMIYVYGQVNAPGTFGIRNGMTIRQALARAGGPTLAGSERNVSIYRGGQKLKKVELESPVQEGDTLFVHERIF